MVRRAGWQQNWEEESNGDVTLMVTFLPPPPSHERRHDASDSIGILVFLVYFTCILWVSSSSFDPLSLLPLLFLSMSYSRPSSSSHKDLFFILELEGENPWSAFTRRHNGKGVEVWWRRHWIFQYKLSLLFTSLLLSLSLVSCLLSLVSSHSIFLIPNCQCPACLPLLISYFAGLLPLFFS